MVRYKRPRIVFEVCLSLSSPFIVPDIVRTRTYQSNEQLSLTVGMIQPTTLRILSSLVSSFPTHRPPLTTMQLTEHTQNKMSFNFLLDKMAPTTIMSPAPLTIDAAPQREFFGLTLNCPDSSSDLEWWSDSEPRSSLNENLDDIMMHERVDRLESDNARYRNRNTTRSAELSDIEEEDDGEEDHESQEEEDEESTEGHDADSDSRSLDFQTSFDLDSAAYTSDGGSNKGYEGDGEDAVGSIEGSDEDLYEEAEFIRRAAATRASVIH